MESQANNSYTGFLGPRSVATGTLSEVAAALCRQLEQGRDAMPLVFDDGTGTQVDLDLRGTCAEVEARYTERPSAVQSTSAEAGPGAKGRGRPRLGVVAREVTLLPEHWDWLARQPGGASVALRKLVHEARQANGTRDRQRRSDERAYKVMLVLAGNLPGFEEASRALFAGNRERLAELANHWPADVGAYVMRLADPEHQGPR